MTDVKLWYSIEGRAGYLEACITPSQNIDHLKRQIVAENVHFFARHRLDAFDITLTKVRYIMISI
jgi:hypothetical protein